MADVVKENVEGVIELVAPKKTKEGKDYLLYRIGDVFYNDFSNRDRSVAVGDKVRFSYSTNAGGFHSLTDLAKLPGMPVVKSATFTLPVNPAFFGMVFNKAVDLAVCDAGLRRPLDWDWRVEIEGKFNLLWALAESLKKSKGVP